VRLYRPRSFFPPKISNFKIRRDPTNWTFPTVTTQYVAGVARKAGNEVVRGAVLADPDSASSREPETDALTDHLFLPKKEDLDKLLRNEAMINLVPPFDVPVSM